MKIFNVKTQDEEAVIGFDEKNIGFMMVKDKEDGYLHDILQYMLDMKLIERAISMQKLSNNVHAQTITDDMVDFHNSNFYDILKIQLQNIVTVSFSEIHEIDSSTEEFFLES